jgi:hypothetical protein
MNPACYYIADVLGAAVVALLAIDPTRPLEPIFILLAMAGCFALLPWMRRGRGD